MDDFKSFINENPQDPPVALDQGINAYIKSELDPPHKLVFAKLLLIQGFIGVITMLFCPQFSLSLTSQEDIFNLLHNTFGHYGCMSICGVIFVGSGALFAHMILSQGDLLKISRSKGLYYFALSSLFLSLFYLVGAEVYLEVATAWLLGASLGGILVFEVSHRLLLISRGLARQG